MSEQYQPGSKEEGGGFQLQVNSPQEEERDYSLMLKRWASNDHDKPTNAGAASNMLGIDQLGALTKRKAESSLGGHDRSTYAFSNLGSASKPGSVAADTWFGMDANPPVGSDQISDVPDGEVEAFEQELARFKSLGLITEAQLRDELKGHTSLKGMMDEGKSHDDRIIFIDTLARLSRDNTRVLLNNAESAAQWTEARDEAEDVNLD